MKLRILTQDLVDGIHEVCEDNTIKLGKGDLSDQIEELLLDEHFRDAIRGLLGGTFGEGERVVLERYD